MPRLVYGVTLSVVFAALVAGAFVWYIARPSSYNECVVSEMRGQAAQMLYEVSKVCGVRFRKEEELPLSYLARGLLDFRMLPDFDKDPGVVMMGSENFEKPPMIITVTKNETDYDITRARMKHSFKFEMDCSRLSDDDWEDGPEFIFSGAVANVAMPAVYDKETKLHRPPFCYKYLKIWGTLRNQ
jgi:hypothetical protein